MKKYFVNDRSQANGDHEVHEEDCEFLPQNLTYLGTFAHCRNAVTEAKKHHRQVNGCRTCSGACHTQ